jgi:hypothetical protein
MSKSSKTVAALEDAVDVFRMSEASDSELFGERGDHIGKFKNTNNVSKSLKQWPNSTTHLTFSGCRRPTPQASSVEISVGGRYGDHTY